MSVPAKHWALAQNVPGSASNRIILYFLAEWVIGEDAVECWPTVSTLCFETGLNRQTVMKATAALEEAGLIEKSRICKKGPKGFVWETHYRLVGFKPQEWIGIKRPTAIGERISKSEKSDVQETVSTKNRTSEKQTREGTKNRTVDGVKNRTVDGVKNRTVDGTKNRTRTGNIQGIDREITGKEITDVPAYEEGYFDSLFEPEAVAPDPAPKKSVKKAAKAPRQWRGVMTDRPSDIPVDDWDQWIQIRKIKNLPVTAGVIDHTRKEAGKAGMTLLEAVQTCIEHGWGGFKAEYVSGKSFGRSSFDRPLQKEDMVYTDDF